MTRCKLQEHVFYKSLAEEVRQFLADGLEVKEGRPQERRRRRPREAYVVTVFEATGEVLSAVDQLYFAINLLAGYRNKSAPDGMSKYDWFVYGVENFLVRYTGVNDRCLRLANDVFRLGLPPRECRHATVIGNAHLKGTPVASALRAVGKCADAYREGRNRVMHAETYYDKSLRWIALYHRVVVEGASDLKRFAPFMKRETDRVVTERKAEFVKATGEMEERLSDLFDALKPVVAPERSLSA